MGPLLRVPSMALGQILPRLVAPRYCGEIFMRAGHMIYSGIDARGGSRDIRRLSHYNSLLPQCASLRTKLEGVCHLGKGPRVVHWWLLNLDNTVLGMSFVDWQLL